MAQTTPDWLRRAVFYEVFPRLHSAAGNFDGVRRDLPRIRDLGVDVLYLMPIYPMGDGRDNRLGSPYGIYDHRAINPEYGDEAALRALVAEAHRLGLKVILDVVLHHLSSRSALAQSKPHWFLRDAAGNPTRKVQAWEGVVDLDYRQPEVWEYQIGTLARWLDCGFDGFRFDVAPLVPLAFWRAARAKLDPQGRQIWLAETGFMQFVKKDRDLGVPHLSDPELHEVFDLTYDADGAEYLYGYFAGQYDLSDYLRQVYLQEVLYPAHAIKLRYLENHDDPRFASKVRDPALLRCWTALMLLLPGAALLYAGQELAIGRDRQPGERGEEHYHRERHNVAWEKGDAAFGRFTRDLIAAAKRIKSECRYARVQQLVRGVVQIDWRGGETAYTALLNLENRHGDAPAPWTLAGTDVLTGKEYRFERSYRIEREPLILRVATMEPDRAREEFRPPTAFGLHSGANWA